MIDKNRGCNIRTSARGAQVVEFKGQPGEYFDVNGAPVELSEAVSAGFDVSSGTKAKRRAELHAEYEVKADEQHRKEYEEIEKRIKKEEDDFVEQKAAEDIQNAPARYEVVKRGKRDFHVVDSAGDTAVECLNKAEADAECKRLNDAPPAGVL